MEKVSKKREKLVKILITLLIFLLISVFSAIILYFCGIIYYDEGLQINQVLFDSFKNTWYGYIIVVVAQIVITSLLSFVPGASMAFIILLKTLYDNPVVSFILAFSGVMLSSGMLYVLGRFGGYNLCKKLIGEEDCEQASELLNHKGLIYFPVMMMFPAFPDDALTMVAGTLKMSLKWFIPSIVLGRGIGVVTIVFGLSLFDFASFEWWHWVLFILICAIGIITLFFFAGKLGKYLESKNKEEKTGETVDKINLNNRNAEVILEEDRYPNGATSPTKHIEYACLCGNGKIINERVIGFDDNHTFIECERCKEKYDVVTGQGYLWELKEKEIVKTK